MKPTRKKLYTVISVSASVIFWILVWAALSWQIDSKFLLPSPIDAVSALGNMLFTLPFWQIIGASVLRILVAILISLLLGTLIATLTAKLEAANTLFAPLMTVIKATPVASFIILAILWIDRNTLPAFITMLIVIPIVWSNVSAGINGVDKKLLEVAKIYRFPLSKRIFKIYVPSTMPYFLAACRASLGMAWKAGIAAEVLCTPKQAIGTQIYFSKTYMETTELFAWTLAVIILSVIIEKILISGLLSLTRKLHVSNTEVK